QGATEGTVKNQTADAIADITSSGETLSANHLKVLGDGLILQSQATLFGLPRTAIDSNNLKLFDTFLKKLDTP
ncbi:MAG: ATP phosphoribosyltransferase catalytic subunit HisG, partial [Paracoccaceae bacterium]